MLGAALGLLVGFAGGGAAELLGTNASSEAALRAPSPSAVASSRERLKGQLPDNTASSKVAPASAGLLRGPLRPSSTCGSPSGRLVRFRVIVESGLKTTPGLFASEVLKVLCDKRSWIGSGKVQFRYDPAGPLLVGLRTADSTERRCMALIHLSVNRYYSCATRSEVVLNADRWFTGSRSWPGTVSHYRQMLVNHEVGHALGQHHRSCMIDGNRAPVMMQQSKGLSAGGNTCTPNAWPLAYEKRSLR